MKVDKCNITLYTIAGKPVHVTTDTPPITLLFMDSDSIEEAVRLILNSVKSTADVERYSITVKDVSEWQEKY